MFQATFLGHQGWMVATPQTVVLIDPLLTPAFGHGGLVGEAYPPRSVDFSAFPAVDAVVITHEHDDHFDIPTLHRIDRSVPVYLSTRSSSAAFDALRMMGFGVTPMGPNETFGIGDLRYRTFFAEHREAGGGDEWDVLPFVVADQAGHGSLFSSVDVKPDARTLQSLAEDSCPPGIWCFANNTTAPVFAKHAPSDDTDVLLKVLERRYREVAAAWGVPACTAIVGAGWSYPGERAWMNRRAFPIDPQRLAAGLSGRVESAPTQAMAPGQTITLRDGALSTMGGSARFMQPRPRAEWPSRAPESGGISDHELSAACSPREFAEHDVSALANELDDFAQFLYGGPIFRGIHSSDALQIDGYSVTVCFELRLDDADNCVLAYDPSRCRFVPHRSTNATAEFLSGYRCWAADLSAFLAGDIGPSALCNAGRLRTWNHRPEVLRASVHELWNFGQPLRRPAAHQQLYARLIEAQPLADPVIAAARNPPRE